MADDINQLRIQRDDTFKRLQEKDAEINEYRSLSINERLDQPKSQAQLYGELSDLEAEVARLDSEIANFTDTDTPYINQQVTGTADIPNSELIGPDAPFAAGGESAGQTIATGEITDIDPDTGEFTSQVTVTPVVPAVFDDAEVETVATSDIVTEPVDLDAQPGVGVGNQGEITKPQETGVSYYNEDEEDIIDFPQTVPDANAQATNGAIQQLKKQALIEQKRSPTGTGDWRVKLRLASGSNYFYNQTGAGAGGLESDAGILRPLAATNGIVFPYTPRIDVVYSAEYNQYQPTHSNYQHYFYKGSKVGEVVVTADFTAQDTAEANYLLAVIHFLKSASKMFYGQDANRGTPPPLLFLSGYGSYQFNEAPCVISQFNYNLPDDVDYIRAGVSGIRDATLQQDLAVKNNNLDGIFQFLPSSVTRLINAGLALGAEPESFVAKTTISSIDNDEATYVPTALTMTLTLLPVQTRAQVSRQFSLKDYSSGNLIRKGYW